MKFPLRLVAVSCAIFLCFVGSSHQVREHVPPKFVYRADFRAPSDLFKNGMKPYGDNDDLAQHVEGKSCTGAGTMDSAFVATTANKGFAKQFGADNLWSGSAKRRFVYLYTIRATSDFYSSYNSLINGFVQTKNRELKEVAEFFRQEFEWVAYNGVDSKLIKSVEIHERGQNELSLSLVSIEENPKYSNADTVASSKYFPTGGTSFIGRVSLLAGSLTVSSCFKSCPKQQSDNSVNSAGEDSASPTCPFKGRVFNTDIDAGTATVWDPIKDSRVEKLVPWKEEVKIEHNRHYTEKPADCTITTGSANDLNPTLKIDCPKNKFYEKFVVKLKAGLHGAFVRLVDKDGITGHTWERSVKQLIIHGHGSLWDNEHRIDEVFSGAGNSDWSSKIKVFPIFPAYHAYAYSCSAV